MTVHLQRNLDVSHGGFQIWLRSDHIPDFLMEISSQVWDYQTREHSMMCAEVLVCESMFERSIALSHGCARHVLNLGNNTLGWYSSTRMMSLQLQARTNLPKMSEL